MKINFSGHPVEGNDIAPLVGVNLPMEAGEALVASIKEALDALPVALQEQLKKGFIPSIILPGMAPAAAILLAEWHGRYGSFPRIAWAVRGPEGFAWPEEATADLSGLREQARLQR